LDNSTYISVEQRFLLGNDRSRNGTLAYISYMEKREKKPTATN